MVTKGRATCGPFTEPVRKLRSSRIPRYSALPPSVDRDTQMNRKVRSAQALFLLRLKPGVSKGPKSMKLRHKPEKNRREPRNEPRMSLGIRECLSAMPYGPALGRVHQNSGLRSRTLDTGKTWQHRGRSQSISFRISGSLAATALRGPASQQEPLDDRFRSWGGNKA
jgi:hypothetical protein